MTKTPPTEKHKHMQHTHMNNKNYKGNTQTHPGTKTQNGQTHTMKQKNSSTKKTYTITYKIININSNTLRKTHTRRNIDTQSSQHIFMIFADRYVYIH